MLKTENYPSSFIVCAKYENCLTNYGKIVVYRYYRYAVRKVDTLYGKVLFFSEFGNKFRFTGCVIFFSHG